MMDSLIESAGMRDDTWVTSEGVHIRHTDLTDSHLRNIIGYLQRQSAECTAGLTVVGGEQAGYALEDEILRIESDLDRLLLECDRRGWSRAAALLGVATSRKERWDEVD
jgi:hypothetical protein